MPELPRLKPAPVPAIHPVPEHRAEGPLAEAYARTKAGLAVPWMGVVAMAFAHYPRFYDCLWRAMEPVVATAAFSEACATLRATAESEAEALGPACILPQLADMGYSPREIEEIRACNEVFSNGNMPYVLMATLARMLLEGHGWDGRGSEKVSSSAIPAARRPVLIEPHHADATVAALYADIRQSLGLTFVNTDYRAFARWPSYFVPAWSGLKSAVQSTDYEPAVTKVHETAVSLLGGLQNVSGVAPQDLIDAAQEDAEASEVLSVVQVFQWLLPGLAVNVGFLRAQLY